jgi:hypothetical protein
MTIRFRFTYGYGNESPLLGMTISPQPDILFDDLLAQVWALLDDPIMIPPNLCALTYSNGAFPQLYSKQILRKNLYFGAFQCFLESSCNFLRAGSGMDKVSETTRQTPSRIAEALECIKRHLPTLREVYATSGSRRTRLMLKEFEMLVQESERISKDRG